MSREQFFQKQVAQKSKIPPVGLHRKRYDAMDRKVSVPVYGESNIWNKHLAKNSKIIKEKDFKEKVKKCERLDKTLVYERQTYTKASADNAFRTRNVGQAAKTAYETDVTHASRSSPRSQLTRR